MPKQRIQWPFRGRVDNNARGDQPELTSSDAQNVRNFAAGTERMQGGQRPGLRKRSADQVFDGPVRGVKSLVYDRSAFDYTQQAPPLTYDWQFANSTDTSTVDVHVDGSGNSYWLTSASVVEKRNPSGVLIWSEAIPATGLELVEKLAVDPDGNIYVALTGGSDAFGKFVRLQRRDDDDGVDLQYSVDVPATEVVDIMYRAGTLFVAASNHGSRQSFVYAYNGLESTDPPLVATYEATYPIRQIAFSRGGLVYCSAPLVDRTTVDNDGGVDSGVVDWSPLDMINAPYRLHCWIDAQGEPDADNNVQTTVPDRRQEYLDLNPSLPYTEFADDTDRGYLTAPHTNTEKPRLDPEGMVLFPAYKFDPTKGYLQRHDRSYGDWGYNLDQGSGGYTALSGSGDWFKDKAQTTSKLSRSTGLFPQTKTQSWAMTMLVRCKTDDPMVLWGLNVGRTYADGYWDPHNYLALCINGGGGVDDPELSDRGLYTTATGQAMRDAMYSTINPFSGTDGKLQRYPQQSAGTATLVTPESHWHPTDGFTTKPSSDALVAHSGGSDWGVQISATGINNAGASGLERTYLVTVSCTVPSGGSPDYCELRVRCNGVTSSDYGKLQWANWGEPSGREVLGHRYMDPDTLVEITPPYGTLVTQMPPFIGAQVCGGYKAFNGWICEAISYFSDSSAPSSPHDETYAGGFFDDIERIEGYIAHKWGVSQTVLPTGHSYRLAPPSGSGSQTSTDVIGDSIAQALRSPMGITAKLNIVTGGHSWAYSGAGMGYGVVADDIDGTIYTTGPKDVGFDPTLTTYPHYDFGATHRKLVDAGSFARIRRAGYASVKFYDQPTAGSTFQLQHKLTDVTYTFDTVSSPTQVLIAPTLAQTLGNLVDKINLYLPSGATYYAVLGAVDSNGGYVVRIYETSDDLNDYEEVVLTLTNNGADTLFEEYHPMFASDTGVKSSSAEESAWTYIENAGVDPNPEDQQFRAAVDADGAFYVPRMGVGTSSVKANHVRKFPSKPNTSENSVGNHPVTGAWTYVLDTSISGDYAARGVAIKPEIEHVWPDSSIVGPEYMWVAADNIKGDGTTISELPTLSRVELVKRTAVNREVRVVEQWAVAGDQAYQLNTGTDTWVSKGTVARTSDSAFVQMVPAFGQLFFVDNGLYKVYDPIKGGGTLETWAADTAGEIPEGCRLSCFYRGRLVVARSDREPHTIYASAVGDPYDWDFFPKVDVPTKAFGGASLDTARNPDVVNALAPFYDDVLLVGGDHSITQYRGDLSDLGQIDYFTDVTGMAFGNSWALSPEGLMYFFGSRGGVWVMSPRSDGRTQPPVELTQDTIAEELRQIDLSQYHPKLVWDQEAQGLHVFVTPFLGSASAETKHYFYETRTKSWWPVLFGADTLQPYSAAQLEAETPTERKVAIGCKDGYVRVFDGAEATDDGTAIESHVLIGPISPPETPGEQRITSLNAIMSSVGSGCRYTLYANDNPDSIGAAAATGEWLAGYNSRVPARARGGYMWIKLQNADAGGQWALESLHADIYIAGRRRDR